VMNLIRVALFMDNLLVEITSIVFGHIIQKLDGLF